MIHTHSFLSKECKWTQATYTRNSKDKTRKKINLETKDTKIKRFINGLKAEEFQMIPNSRIKESRDQKV